MARESSCNQQNSYFNVICLTNVTLICFLYLKAQKTTLMVGDFGSS